MSLAKRSITSAVWNVIANGGKIIILFVRSIMLARLLPIEVFGIYAFASSIVGISATLPSFGMGGAFIHRAPETENESQAAAVHFTLKLIFTLIWAGILAIGTLIFADGQVRIALLVLIITTGGLELTQTPRLILTRRVMHRRLALLQLLGALLTTTVALILAWQGVTLWALLATDFVRLALGITLLYLWKPMWQPQLVWSTSIVRYFLNFGSKNFIATLLLKTLNQVDDLWTGIFLGKTSLGFYSRAYTFATYPRQILATPINAIAGGTYAELKKDRKRLSQAFFRTNALLTRSGFLLAGLVVLIAPEFIRLVLSAKWMPMLDAFRLMLIFTLLDPIKITVADLFVAMGTPETVARIRMLQLIILIPSLFLLGLPFGIAGVALAVDIMMVTGIVILLQQSKKYVDISLKRLFVVPGIALTLGILLAHTAAMLPFIQESDWQTGLIKIIVFTGVYTTILILLEYHQINELVSMIIKHFIKTS